MRPDLEEECGRTAPVDATCDNKVSGVSSRGSSYPGGAATAAPPARAARDPPSSGQDWKRT